MSTNPSLDQTKAKALVDFISSANHDGSVFREPERFNICRSISTTSHDLPHIGFGHGIHFCLGAPLARLEGQTVLRVILKRLQDLKLDPDYSNYGIAGLNPSKSAFFHGVAHLPLCFRPGEMI
jgi:cytochrome P450